LYKQHLTFFNAVSHAFLTSFQVVLNIFRHFGAIPTTTKGFFIARHFFKLQARAAIHGRFVCICFQKYREVRRKYVLMRQNRK